MTDFATRIKVRGYHEDRFGHVNNARYLEFLEEGRWDYLDERGPQGGFSSLGIFPVVVHLDVSYRRQSSAGDTLRIATRITGAGSRKFVMHQDVIQEKDEKICCEADVTIVLVDARTGRPATLGDEVLRAWPELAVYRDAA
jgi:thioesterase III